MHSLCTIIITLLTTYAIQPFHNGGANGGVGKLIKVAHLQNISYDLVKQHGNEVQNILSEVFPEAR
jgi:hypothetical protein